MTVQEKFEKQIEENREAMLKDLAALVAVNSARGETKPGAPFGEGPLKALQTFLAMAERMGFKTDNVDNYAGAVEYGDGAESVGVLAHLDVVPAGKGWDTDPFVMTEKDGRFYGRGTTDDKGAAIAALYGMKMIRDLGLPLKRKIQLIVGTNEEEGSAGLEYYKAHRPCPVMGFTPDADYPLINGEKGTYFNWLKFPLEQTPILEMNGGIVFNAVPSECTVKIDGSAISVDDLKASLKKDDTLDLGASVEKDADGNTILTVKGRAAHGSTPELGVNAIVSAAAVLCRALGMRAGKMMFFLRDKIGRDPYGQNVGIAMEDMESGKLSLNVGMIRYNSAEQKLAVDIRFPVSATVELMKNKYDKMAAANGLTYTVTQPAEPHFVSRDSELVTKLVSVYRNVMHDPEAKSFSIGGGTYAKTMGNNFVAFGPEFPNRENLRIHDVNEHMILEDYLKHCLISTLAVYELCR